MYSVEFIFEPGSYDDEFYSLDNQIQAAAESMDGFVGKEGWRSADGKKVNSIYYWEDMETLKKFSSNPKHLEAKSKYTKWYNGYHIVISEVKHSYGDGRLTHPTPNRNKDK